MLHRMLWLTPLLVGLTACEAPTIKSRDTVLRETLAGKTLVNESARFELNADGTARGSLEGEDYAGTWRISRGQFCGFATKPERFNGFGLCSDVEIVDESTVVLTRAGERAVFALR